MHGLAEHSQRYDYVARRFAELGYHVHAFDQRGHGHSEGRRAYAKAFETLLDDIELFLAHIAARDPSGPLILMGHSMGGLEVASLLALRKPAVAAAVLSGPTAQRFGADALRYFLLREARFGRDFDYDHER